jgi:serine/threonine protein phosphatase PrpC
VFDGHGGWQVSQLCQKKMHIYLDEFLKNAKSEEQVKSAIKNAFLKIEQEWIDFTTKGF